MKIHNFKELKVWQKSMTLCKMVYEITSTFPADEKFGLKSQIQRCAISIPSNIAEGSGRNGDKEFQHFLSIANGSAFELETQIILAKDFNYISDEHYSNITILLTEVEKMIYGFYQTLNK
jgi:four helix bundle protein